MDSGISFCAVRAKPAAQSAGAPAARSPSPLRGDGLGLRPHQGAEVCINKSAGDYILTFQTKNVIIS